MAAAFLPRLSSPLAFSISRWANFYTTQYTLKFLPSLSIAVPGVTINLPGLLGDIWESVLRAVPKNKVSHSKKRSRQMAGKALKDVNHLCKCPGCGEVKRTHRLCQNCLEGTATQRHYMGGCFNTDTLLQRRNEANLAPRLSCEQTLLGDGGLDLIRHLSHGLYLTTRPGQTTIVGICLSRDFVSLYYYYEHQDRKWGGGKRYPDEVKRRKNL